MRGRIVILVVVLAAQMAVPALYGSSDAAEAPFLDEEDLVGEHDPRVGAEAVIYGQVESVDPVVIRHRLDGGTVGRFTVVGVDRDLTVGQYLEVYAVVGPDDTLVARNTVVRGEREHWYTYGVSLFAVLLVLGLVLRDWTLDADAWVLHPSGEDCDA